MVKGAVRVGMQDIYEVYILHETMEATTKRWQQLLIKKVNIGPCFSMFPCFFHAYKHIILLRQLSIKKPKLF